MDVEEQARWGFMTFWQIEGPPAVRRHASSQLIRSGVKGSGLRVPGQRGMGVSAAAVDFRKLKRLQEQLAQGLGTE